MNGKEELLIKINGIVKMSGQSIDSIANAMKITRQTLSSKLNGQVEFKINEVYDIINICNYQGVLEMSK